MTMNATMNATMNVKVNVKVNVNSLCDASSCLRAPQRTYIERPRKGHRN